MADSEIRLANGDAFSVEGGLDEVEKSLSNAARQGPGTLAWLTERDGGDRVGVNPAQVATLRAAEP